MKKAILFLLAVLPFFGYSSSAQVAHDITRPVPIKNIKRHPPKTKIQFVAEIPDSIANKIQSASQKLMKLAAADIKKYSSADSVYIAHTWAAYKSPVLGNAQILIDINCTLSSDKRKGKPLVKTYSIAYLADHDIFKVYYEGDIKTITVKYNESHWPGYMYNDKAPKKDDLNRDIVAAMNKILKSNMRLDDNIAKR